MKYFYTPAARDDLHDAVVFYDAQREGLGVEFAVEVGLGLAEVLEAPKRWPKIEPDIRKYRLKRFPYALL